MKTKDNDTLVLLAGRFRFIHRLLFGSSLLAVSLWVVSRGHWLGWAGVLLFGLLVITALIHLLPGATCLIIRKRGFELRWMYRPRYFLWAEIAVFTIVIDGPPYRSVFCLYSDQFVRDPGVVDLEDGYLELPDNFGMYPVELADLLNEWMIKNESKPRKR